MMSQVANANHSPNRLAKFHNNSLEHTNALIRLIFANRTKLLKNRLPFYDFQVRARHQ